MNNERRLAEADAGDQQLLEKLIEGKGENCENLQNFQNLLSENCENLKNLQNLLSEREVQIQQIDLDVENKNKAQMLVALQESVNIQVQETKKVEAERQRSEAKAKEDLDANASVNARAISDLKDQLGETIAQRVKPTEDKLGEVDSEISGLRKAVAIFESCHVETTRSLKKVTALTERIQTRVNDQDQKMAEQSANDLNWINDRLQDMENQSGLADQKIKELNAGNPSLLDKVLGLGTNLSERLDKHGHNTFTGKIDEMHSNHKESVSFIQITDQVIYEGFEVQCNERFDAIDGASAAALNLTYGDKLDSENQLVSFLSILEVAKQSFSEHLRRLRGPRMVFCEPVSGNDSFLPGSVKVFTNSVCEKSFTGRNMMEACNRNKLDLLKAKKQ